MKTAISMQPETVLPIAELQPGAPAYKMADQIHDQIAQRAFELFCASGRTHGHALQDWCQAETQLFEPVNIEIEQNKTEYTAHAALRGFDAKDIELCADSRHLFIAAKHTETSSEQGLEAVHTYRVFRIVELPSEIDPKAVTAFLSQKSLEVVLPRVVEQHKSQAVAAA